MRDWQACATLSHPGPRTRNEQVSGSSPPVGFLLWSSFAGETLIEQARAVFRPALLTTTQPKKRALRLTLERVDLGSNLIPAANQNLDFAGKKQVEGEPEKTGQTSTATSLPLWEGGASRCLSQALSKRSRYFPLLPV